jgi:seryl-tRNA synthetase
MNKHVSDFSEIVLELPRGVVDPEVAGDIEKESVFVSPMIEKIRANADLKSVTVVARPGADMAVVADKATRYLEVMVKQVAGFEPKVFVETKRRDTGPYQIGVNDGLVERGWMHDYGKGQVAYSGPVLRLTQLINQRAGELYHKAFGAVDGHFPAMIDADTLQKCGYFDSHPNAVTFMGNVVEDFDAIEEFRRANSCSEGAVLPSPEHIHVDGMCLNPAACFPCYPTLKGRVYETGECYTWMGRVFRYESRNINGLDRLYEFNVRELVFVGTPEYCADVRAKSLPIIEELAALIDIDCKVQTATDPFFATVSAAKKFFQAAQEVKNEIKIPALGNDGSVKHLACGSINLHGSFFGQRFGFNTKDGAPAQTGCVGLGIERWVLAAFTQHGFEPSRWPTEVRKHIFG